MAAQREDRKDTLKKVNVPELRNEKEIIRAIQYTETELRSHLELTADTESQVLIIKALLEVVNNIGLGQTSVVLSRSIGDLLETVSSLDQAALDLVAGAEAQALEFGKELEMIVANKEVLSAVSLPDVEAEVKRRTEEQQMLSDNQEELENEIFILENKIASLGPDQKAKTEKSGLEITLEATNKTLQTIKEIGHTNRLDIETLKAYERAMKMVSTGLPKDLMGKQLSFRKTK
jgi:hypothetical protein